MKQFRKKIKDLNVRKANLSMLNNDNLKKLSRLKYYVIKYNSQTKSLETKIVYKTFNSASKIVLFDAIISYQNYKSERFRPYFSLYVPTLFIDYVKFQYKDTFLSNIESLTLDDPKKISEDIYNIFSTQNKFYKMEDYRQIKKFYNLTKKSSYKDKIKALDDYTRDREAKPSFYLWLAIMYDVAPFVHYMGKSMLETPKYTKDKIFFIYPDKNSSEDKEDK